MLVLFLQLFELHPSRMDLYHHLLLVPVQALCLFCYYFSAEELQDGWRLSCNSKVLSDCVIWVPDIASAYQSRMKTADLSSPQEIAIFQEAQEKMRASGISLENNFRSFVVSMTEPSLDDTMPDNERLTWAIQEALGDVEVKLPFAVMVGMAHTLRENNFICHGRAGVDCESADRKS